MSQPIQIVQLKRYFLPRRHETYHRFTLIRQEYLDRSRQIYKDYFTQFFFQFIKFALKNCFELPQG